MCPPHVPPGDFSIASGFVTTDAGILPLGAAGSQVRADEIDHLDEPHLRQPIENFELNATKNVVGY
jgi:hypothetical protein